MQLQADSDINTQPNFPGLISILNQLLINRNTAFLSQLPSLLDDFTNQLTELIEAIGYNVSSQRAQRAPHRSGRLQRSEALRARPVSPFLSF